MHASLMFDPLDKVLRGKQHRALTRHTPCTSTRGAKVILVLLEKNWVNWRERPNSTQRKCFTTFWNQNCSTPSCMKSWHSSTAAPSGRANQQGATVSSYSVEQHQPPPPRLLLLFPRFHQAKCKNDRAVLILWLFFLWSVALHSCTIKSVQPGPLLAVIWLGGSTCCMKECKNRDIGTIKAKKVEIPAPLWANVQISGSVWDRYGLWRWKSCHATTNKWHNFHLYVCFGPR